MIMQRFFFCLYLSQSISVVSQFFLCFVPFFDVSFRGAPASTATSDSQVIIGMHALTRSSLKGRRVLSLGVDDVSTAAGASDAATANGSKDVPMRDRIGEVI